jgi:hypothetical protein
VEDLAQRVILGRQLVRQLEDLAAGFADHRRCLVQSAEALTQQYDSARCASGYRRFTKLGAHSRRSIRFSAVKDLTVTTENLSLLFIGKIFHRRDMPNITTGVERSLIDDVFIFVGRDLIRLEGGSCRIDEGETKLSPGIRIDEPGSEADRLRLGLLCSASPN